MPAAGGETALHDSGERVKGWTLPEGLGQIILASACLETRNPTQHFHHATRSGDVVTMIHQLVVGYGGENLVQIGERRVQIAS